MRRYFTLWHTCKHKVVYKNHLLSRKANSIGYTKTTSTIPFPLKLLFEKWGLMQKNITYIFATLKLKPLCFYCVIYILGGLFVVPFLLLLTSFRANGFDASFLNYSLWFANGTLDCWTQSNSLKHFARMNCWATIAKITKHIRLWCHSSMYICFPLSLKVSIDFSFDNFGFENIFMDFLFSANAMQEK